MSKKRFIYHGYLQIAELDAADATESAMPVLRKTYLWDPLEPAATRILAMSLFDETGTWAEDLYYTHDLLKNTTALFGIRAGRRALYEYGPYGNIVRMEGNAAEDNPFRFSSEYADDELGLVYYNYRYYNPQNGRWISRDPMMERLQENLYGYVGNSATIFIDFLGQIDSVTLYAAKSLAAGMTEAEVLANLAAIGYVGACARKILQNAVEYNNGHGKGERKTTSKPDGTGNPYKHTRPDPKDSRRILRKNPHTGKEQSEPKPEGYDDWWKKKHNR